jgi:hypothetical protein
MDKVTIGSDVLFVLEDKYGEDQIRPGKVVRVWNDEMVQLQVFTDGTNDGAQYASGIYWATSVQYSETHEPRTWHWPEIG